MGAFGKIFFAFLIYIILEIYVFIEVAERIGFLSAAALLVFFSITGYIITKRIKYIAFQNVATDYYAGKSVSKNLIKSAAYFISGVLFFIPGFISDFLALFFLIPFINYYIIYFLLKHLKNKFITGGNGGFYYYSSGAYNNAHNEPDNSRNDVGGKVEDAGKKKEEKRKFLEF